MLHYYQNGAKGEETVFSSLKKAKFLFKVSMMFSHFKNTLLSQINRFTIGNWYRKSRRSKSRLRSQVLCAAENSSSLTFLLQHWVFFNNFYWAAIPWAQNSHPKPSSHFLRRRGKHIHHQWGLTDKAANLSNSSDYNFIDLFLLFQLAPDQLPFFFLGFS